MSAGGRICADRGPFRSLRGVLTARPPGGSVGEVTLSRTLAGRRRRLTSRVRPLVSTVAVVSVATLVPLHVALLWDRFSHGRLSDPEVALRWLGAAVLTVAVLALRRLGIPLLWGRRALVFWLLVLLLHAGAAAPEDPAAHATPVRLLFVVPASVAPLWVLLVLLVAPLVQRAGQAPVLLPMRGFADSAPALRGGFLLALSPRAPPA